MASTTLSQEILQDNHKHQSPRNMIGIDRLLTHPNLGSTSTARTPIAKFKISDHRERISKPTPQDPQRKDLRKDQLHGFQKQLTKSARMKLGSLQAMYVLITEKSYDRFQDYVCND